MAKASITVEDRDVDGKRTVDVFVDFGGSMSELDKLDREQLSPAQQMISDAMDGLSGTSADFDRPAARIHFNGHEVAEEADLDRLIAAGK
jgi:hypothetical protein